MGGPYDKLTQSADVVQEAAAMCLPGLSIQREHLERLNKCPADGPDPTTETKDIRDLVLVQRAVLKQESLWYERLRVWIPFLVVRYRPVTPSSSDAHSLHTHVLTRYWQQPSNLQGN